MVVVKVCFVKGGFFIFCLELVVGYMVINLFINVRNVLDGLLILNVYGWLDSIVVLYWIWGSGEFK